MELQTTISFILLSAVICQGNPAKGPLVIHPDNQRYFMVKGDRQKKVVYLTGSHHWANLQDKYCDDLMDDQQWPNYLLLLKKHNHNYIRGWHIEHASEKGEGCSGLWLWSPLPFDRTGPGSAIDGRPKFDLTKYNQQYFDRIRKRAIDVGKNGIYISIMLFQGWSIDRKNSSASERDPWRCHPFNAANNINGINGDLDGDGQGLEIHTLRIPEITKLQEAYVAHTIDQLNDLDNILWEISNESHKDSASWQYHMIKFIKDYEATKPKQHLVGMTGYCVTNAQLFDSPADWISPDKTSPTHKEGYRHDPPDAAGKKIIIADTDHLWGIGGNHSWVWRTFLRGMHPIFMDPIYVADIEKSKPKLKNPAFPTLRMALGHTRKYAEKINLAKMSPQNHLSTTTFCLANPGVEYIVYNPEKKPFTVKLLSGAYYYEWFDPQAGKVLKTGKITVKTNKQAFTPLPSCVCDSVLYLKKVE